MTNLSNIDNITNDNEKIVELSQDVKLIHTCN
jgi:hypothetical protein